MPGERAVTPRSFWSSGGKALRNVELILLALLVVLPLVSRDAFFVDRIGRFLLLAVFALSVDLIWGYGAMFTFGQAAFFGGAGYVVGMLSTRDAGILPLPLGVTILGAVVASALLALGISYFTFARRGGLRGVEFAVVTLAVSVALERLANAGGPITGGQNGILMTYRLGPFHRGHGFYVLAAAILVIVYLGLKGFLRSRAGLVFRGIGQNEERVELLGYDVPRVKRWTFVLSGSIAGLAGSLFYLHEGIVSPAAVGVGSSTLVLLWVVLGGKGTLIGPIVGAVALPYLTARLSGTLLDTWLVVVGVIL
ncbi:MAG TPA: branched-chain amino acid ABC transporter permease, partial [Acidimicrobiia bacterium]|nr:branched-chain amino acid ABC transporter permease [Acidimicrobiia bacterium]